MAPPPDGADPSSRGVSRRAFVGGLTAFAALAGGCNGVTNYAFSAPPVVLPEGARQRLGYHEHARDSLVFERTREVGGVEVTATVESQLALYRAVGADDPGASGPSIGVVSTPEASVQGRSFNPLARRSLSNLLTSEVGTSLLSRADLDRVAGSDSITWIRGPTLVAGREGICLGVRTTLESYAGVLASDPPAVAYVHLARVDPDSVVVAAAVHGHEIDERGNAFVGPAPGYLSQSAFDDAVGTYARATESFEYADGGG